jgi:hypothetical protein
MDSYSEKLQQLRPVAFHLKTDPQGALQYGLIAEEVAKVYPELVIRDATGRIDGVRYDELAPMLLNEVQRQRSKIEAQAAINSTQAQEYAALAKRSAAEESQLRSLQRQLADVHAVLVKLEAKDKDELVARR